MTPRIAFPRPLLPCGCPPWGRLLFALLLIALLGGCGGQGDPGLPPDLYTTTDPGRAAPQFPATVDFGDQVRLLAFDLLESRDGPVLVTYWTALRPLTDTQPLPWPFFYNEEDGQHLSARPQWPPTAPTADDPASGWRWPPPGHVVRLALPALALGDRRPDAGIGVGVLATPNDGARWLPATPGGSEVVMRLDSPERVTLARLRGGAAEAEMRRFAGPASLAHPTETRFGGTIALRGYDLAVVPGRAGNERALLVTLHWQALQPIEADLRVRVELLDEAGRPRVAAESAPRVGLRPTSGWLEGEWIADSYRLPLPEDATPTTLAIGLQDETGAPLSCEGTGANGGSRAEYPLTQLP